MPRPQKKRYVCCLPEHGCFVPERLYTQDPVVITVDEYETIRLIDLEHYTQEECSLQMHIARSTVQGIYSEARRKIADAIVNGKSFLISGGDYLLCQNYEKQCGKGCQKRQHKSECRKDNLKESMEGNTMKIAVTYENGEIFQHFGHTEQFKIYEVAEGQIVTSYVADTMGSGHGALAGFLAEHQVDALICGGIGGGAQTALSEAKIKLYGGVSGVADEAVKALIKGTLDFNAEVTCSHHDHEHEHGTGHTCGSHGCKSHDGDAD